MKVVTFPRTLDNLSMYQLLYEVIDDDNNPRDISICFDFHGLNFIRPVGVTILSNLIEWLIKRDVKVYFRNHTYNDLPRKATKYLDDSLFFDRYMGRKIFPVADLRPTTLPLILVSHSECYDWLENKFIAKVASWMEVDSSRMSSLKICIEEIFNNIIDHSQEEIGCVFAQYYPNKKEVNIAISDFGVGIPTHVKKIFPELDDGTAIKKAVEQGFSTKSTPRNRGAGLDTLLNNVVMNNKGLLNIHSNLGILKNISDNKGKIVSIPDTRFIPYPGTLFEITLYKNTINLDELEEEDFSW